MNCANHPDVPAVAYCRTCGKPLCSGCGRDVRGVIYCEECLASHVSGVVPPPGSIAVPPGVEPSTSTPSPTLAAILGFIPGVGAMYNGEFAKGFVHVLIFATLIWMTQELNGIFGVCIAAFEIYMPIEAYKTARAREMGLPSPDPFGFNNFFSSGLGFNRAAGTPPNVAPVAGTAAVVGGEPVEEPRRADTPIGAWILIGLGVLFLLNAMDLLHISSFLHRFWPLVLIAIGVRILMQRQQRAR
jgi:hypothetical protein